MKTYFITGAAQPRADGRLGYFDPPATRASRRETASPNALVSRHSSSSRSSTCIVPAESRWLYLPLATEISVDRKAPIMLASFATSDAMDGPRQSRRHEIHPPVHLSFRVGYEDAGLDTRAKFPALATRKPADVPRVRVAARLAPVRCSEAAGCCHRQTSNRTIEHAKPSARRTAGLRGKPTRKWGATRPF